MLHRVDSEGVIVISQPAHAWVSGQLARAWGNRQFGDFLPFEEVCLAAEQHDIGFLEWEQAPAWNPQTGLPYTFSELPTGVHLDIWTKGIRQMLRFGRYPALLVSLHYTTLRLRQAAYTSPDAPDHERQFLEEQGQFQAQLVNSLRTCPRFARFSTDKAVERNRQLVAAWDWLSLLICMGLTQPQRVPDAPAAEGCLDLILAPGRSDPGCVVVSPWPFRSDRVQLVCEGRHLPQRYASETDLRHALESAPAVALSFELIPQ